MISLKKNNQKLVVILYLFTNYSFSLDTTFGSGNGYVQTSVDSIFNEINKIRIQSSDDKIVVSGFSTLPNNMKVFALARYNTDGSLDTVGFNSGGLQPGIITTAITNQDSAFANNLEIQTDGKIVAVGYSFDGTNGKFLIVRYTTNGILDTAGFNASGLQPGVVTTLIGATASNANAIKIQSDNKIVVGGIALFDVPNFALVRYNTDGTLDTTFNTTGIVTTLINNHKYW